MLAALVATLRHPWTQKLGRWLALGCAVHCAVMPLVLALVPAAAAALGVTPGLERALVGSSLVIAAVGLVRGYRRHGRAGALLLFGAAAALAVLGQLWHGPHLPATTAWEWLGHGLTAAGLLLLLPANLLDHRREHEAAARLGRPPCCHHAGPAQG
jgi:MerC mercury resistance protein